MHTTTLSQEENQEKQQKVKIMYSKLAKENLIETPKEGTMFCYDLLSAFEKDGYNNGKGFIVSVERVTKHNTYQQLRGYWRLIDLVWQWMRGQGNICTKEEVSDYFKIQAGHYNIINDTKCPRSIALSSGTTVDDMHDIIETIEQFGAEFDIADCQITPLEWDSIETLYNKE